MKRYRVILDLELDESPDEDSDPTYWDWRALLGLRSSEYFSYSVRDTSDIGFCDTCDTEYKLSDRIDHCPECGTCWEHCRERDVHGI